MIVGGGNEAVRADRGYMPQKLSWTLSRALGMGLALKYIMSASLMTLGMYFS